MKKTIYAALVALIAVPSVASAMTADSLNHSDRVSAIFAQIAAESKEDE